MTIPSAAWLRAGADTGNRDSLGDTANMRAARDSAFLVEEAPRTSVRGPRRPPAPTRPVVPIDDTVSAETAINLDQGDPLAEADFHMAYGLYDQAADLVRIAIAREPERRDLKLKLLEVFFVWGNKEQFLHSAHELAATRVEARPGEWEKILIMGKQLAPEDPLFSAAARPSAALPPPAWTWTSKAAEPHRLRSSRRARARGRGRGDIDLDIGTAIGSRRTRRPSRRPRRAPPTRILRCTALDFGQDASSATTRQMTQHMEPPSDGVEPTVEQPAPASRRQPDDPPESGKALQQTGAVEQTAELAIDDLGLDLGALDTVDQPTLVTSPDSPTLVAGLDDTSRQLMDEATQQSQGPTSGSGASGVWRVKPEDMDVTLPPVAMSEFEDKTGHDDTSGTSRLAALKGQDLDFDLGDMDSSAPAANGVGEVDLDVGGQTVPDAAFTTRRSSPPRSSRCRISSRRP